MELTWLGSAGFQVKTGETVFFIDPYLSRNPSASPRQALKPSDLPDPEQVFLSHGHFDHILDIPDIAGRSSATVFCDQVAGATLTADGLPQTQLHLVSMDGQQFNFKNYRAEAYFSRHVKFDIPLLLGTLAKINVRFFSLLPLIKKYPPGQVLSWRFEIEGKTVHHFGSGGSTPEELAKFSKMKTDVLLIPLQGHTRICDIALDYVKYFSPEVVIPHHQDDFYPPVSKMVDIKPFIEGVRQRHPDTEVRELQLNETIQL